MHSAKPTSRLLFALARKAGIRDVVISPGSRNAPLIIEAAARDDLRKHVVTDERSAAFIALGLAEATGRPVMTVCTSGTAVLNQHPAVAEAFYRRIPLVVVSADRPPYRIDKGEGQSIRQRYALQNHTLASVHVPEDDIREHQREQLARALQTAVKRSGPVHINLPFEEPLYERTTQTPDLPDIDFEPPQARPLPEEDLDRLERIWQQAGPKLIIAAQGRFDPTVALQLQRLARMPDTVVLTENTANLRGDNLLEHIDRLIFPLSAEEWENYAPGLVLTVGNNIISKKIKYLLRGQKRPFVHWHAGPHYISPDTFDRLTAHIQTPPEMFFSQMLFRLYDRQFRSDYAARWHALAEKRRKAHTRFLKKLPPSDMLFYHMLSRTLQGPWHVHWSNSTVVRYAQLFPFDNRVKHYANRGTSGIDGSLSTALGFALGTGRPVLHVTGDLSFVYDSNALWNLNPGNLKIIVLDNGGGDIFRFIPGPSTVPGYEKYFVAPHQTALEDLARAYGRTTRRLDLSASDAGAILSDFLAKEDSTVLFVNTRPAPNAKILKDYFRSL